MRVHHLNCGTMRPFAGAPMVTHVLLLETDAGLVLIDAGIGRRDIADPKAATGGGPMDVIIRPDFAVAETAHHQVAALGYRPEDVRHIVVTHLDFDHVGGVRDFPWARVHVHAPELRAALSPRTYKERHRYRCRRWTDMPRWAPHETDDGEDWFGFRAVRPLDGLPPEILLVPLAGHTRGHAAIAVDTGDRWLLHCGDGYFHHGETDPARPRCPAPLRAFQNLIQVLGPQRRHNRRRLLDLVRGHGEKVTVFSAHDPVEYSRLATSADG